MKAKTSHVSNEGTKTAARGASFDRAKSPEELNIENIIMLRNSLINNYKVVRKSLKNDVTKRPGFI